jgi:hypothetical protein
MPACIHSYSYSIWHGKAVQPTREPEAHGVPGTKPSLAKTWIEQICPQLAVAATAALEPLHASSPYNHLSAFDCTPWWLPVLLNLALQFLSTIYSTTSTVAAFTTTLSATAAKRTGYAYVTSATSNLNTIPAADLWAYEANTVGNATVC